MITVRVPATTANIGPGFDCLGIALSLYTTVSFSSLIKDNHPSNLYNNSNQNNVIISGCDSQYATKDNLIYKAFCETLAHMNKPVPPITIHIDSDIPVSRGLGSSAACIVAGVMAANAWYESPLTKQQMFELATKIEGHPDNIAPAMYGGLCASMVDNGIPYSFQSEIHSSLVFSTLIPNITLSTTLSRSVLPASVPLQHAVHNISRSIFVMQSLKQGDTLLLKKSISDYLHQPYRISLIPDYNEIYEKVTIIHDGAMYISGAGPTLMIINNNHTNIETMMRNLKSSLSCHWDVMPLCVDTTGATIERK